MLDIKRIKDDPEAVKAGLRAKEVDCDAAVDRILELDAQRRALILSTETDKAEQNRVSKEIPKRKKAGEDVAPIFARMAELKAQIAQNDQKLTDVEAEYRTLMLSLPNLPDPDLKPGGKENNEPLRYYGEPHHFDFEPKHHVDLCTDLGLIDYERGTRLAGSGFWIYRGMGARLEWALLNYFIDEHLKDGYEMVGLPLMLEYQCGETAGQFPKFADEVYKIENPTDDRMHFMLPTAETALASLHRGEILAESDLPHKLFAYTPCFRREAGSHRADERGMVRGHQFNKATASPNRSRRCCMSNKTRLDVLLVERGFAPTRQKAQAIIMAGSVFAAGQRVDKPGTAVANEAELEVRGHTLRYVSRGGLKLEKAMQTFPITLEGKTCADIGASTGGFTDCMLQNGARRVYAVDVGYGQLDWKLRSDERVVCLERTNARYLSTEQIPEPLDFASIDVSFISLKLIFPALYPLLREGGEIACLIKPQFEAGREKVGKKGVVRDPAVHLEVLQQFLRHAKENNFTVLGITYSPIRGPEGNIEYLGFLRKSDEPDTIPELSDVVTASHDELKD